MIQVMFAISLQIGTATGGDPATESVAPIQEMGSGVKALNDILLTENYRQNPYNQGNKDSARFRTIEGSADVLSTFSSTAVSHISLLI